MRDEAFLRRWVRVACGVTIVYSLVIVLIRYTGSEGEPGSLRISLSLAAPFAVAAVVALIAQSANRGHFVMAAGAGIIPAAMISVVAWPLWIPAVALLFFGWYQLSTTRVLIRDFLAGAVVTAGIVMAMVALLYFRDPIEWQDGTVEQYSNNTITASESLISASFLGLVVIVALATARPRASEI